MHKIHTYILLYREIQHRSVCDENECLYIDMTWRTKVLASLICKVINLLHVHCSPANTNFLVSGD